MIYASGFYSRLVGVDVGNAYQLYKYKCSKNEASVRWPKAMMVMVIWHLVNGHCRNIEKMMKDCDHATGIEDSTPQAAIVNE